MSGPARPSCLCAPPTRRLLRPSTRSHALSFLTRLRLDALHRIHRPLLRSHPLASRESALNRYHAPLPALQHSPNSPPLPSLLSWPYALLRLSWLALTSQNGKRTRLQRRPLDLLFWPHRGRPICSRNHLHCHCQSSRVSCLRLTS